MYIFFFREFSYFPSGLPLHALQSGMMIKLRDNAGLSQDVCRADGQFFNMCRKTKSQSNLKIKSV